MQKRFYMKDGGGGRHPSLIVILFIIVFVIVVILVGLYILGANSRQAIRKQLPPVPSPTVTTIVSPTASPSGVPSVVPSVQIDRHALRIVVLNGSGLPGAASGISSYLAGLGYTVVSVGNADSYAYRNVTVLVKSNKSSYAQFLKKDLQEKVASVSASLSDAISGDAEVIVGR